MNPSPITSVVLSAAKDLHGLAYVGRIASPRRRGARVFAAVALVATTGCDAITLPWQKATPCSEFRSTSGKGEAPDVSGGTLALATIGLIESRGTSLSFSLNFVVYGRSQTIAGPLRGHVTAGRVVGPNGELVFQAVTIAPIPGAEGGGALFRGVGMNYADTVAFRRVRDLLMANALVVELDTDYPSAGNLRIPVRLDQAADFMPLYCK